jgi:hypothetical protein
MASDFNPMLVVTTQPHLADLFLRSVDVGQGMAFSKPTALFLGQRIRIFVLSRGQTLDGDGDMSVDFDVEIRKPDGSVERAANQVARRGKVPSSRTLVFPDVQLTYWEENAARTGRHEIRAVVRDRVAGAETELRDSVEVAPFVWLEPAAGFNRNEWLMRYYSQPTPALLLSGLEGHFSGMSPRQLDGAMAVLLGFYDQVLRDNEWLQPLFARAYDGAEGLRRVGLEFAMGYFLRRTKSRPAWCGETLWEDSAPVREFGWPELSAGVPRSSQELDVLWGRFFASGRFEWVERVASAVEYADYPGKTAEGDTLTRLAQEAVLRSALGSLGVNARAHPAVRGYAAFLARAGKWTREQRELIGKAAGVWRGDE